MSRGRGHRQRNSSTGNRRRVFGSDTAWAAWELDQENEQRSRRHLPPLTPRQFAHQLKQGKREKALYLAVMAMDGAHVPH